MNHPTSIHFARWTPQCGLILAMINLLYATASFAAAFETNDNVKLTRDTALLYLDKPFRQGTAAETFKVLAYKADQKKVYLATKDAAGKQIAVSVSEDALALVPPDKVSVEADVLAAATRQRFDVAKSTLDHALRASPDDVDLHTMDYALQAVIRSAQQLNQVLDAQKSVDADLKRRRRNADVTDHVNPLDPSDNSGQQRAQKIRAEAAQIEVEASQVLRTAQMNYDASLAALKPDVPLPVSPVLPSPSNTTVEKQIGLRSQGSAAEDFRKRVDDARQKRDQKALVRHEENQKKDVAEKTFEDGAMEAERREKESLKQFTDDEAVIPGSLVDIKPSYEDTIDFINVKLKGSNERIWFGKNAQKLIDEDESYVILIEPKDLNPETKVGSFHDELGTHYFVQIETTNSKDSIQDISKFGRLPVNEHRLSFRCEDEVDAEKVAKAFSHLIAMFGGKPGTF